MRDYDATLGRYIQADPLGLVDGASVYGYALQNPARWSDPRGEVVGADDAAAAMVAGAAYAYAACLATPACREAVEHAGKSAAEMLPYATAIICPGALPIFWESKEHTSGARPSTKGKHEKGNARRGRDRGGENADDRREPPRKPPPNHKGPWPPKKPDSP